MSISGLGLGGFATGYQNEQQILNQQNVEQQKLKLAQQAQQNEQQRFQQAQYMDLRKTAISDMSETIRQIKIAHPDYTDQQIMASPMVQSQVKSLSGYDQNLQKAGFSINNNDAMSIAAGFIARPSEAVTAKALAEATGTYGKNQAETEEARARTNLLNTEAGAGLGSDTTMKGLANRAGMSEDEFTVAARSLYNGNTTVAQNVGRGAQGGVALKALKAGAYRIALDENGGDPDKAAAALNQNVIQFNATKAGQSSEARSAGTAEARLGITNEALNSAIQPALAASADVPRGDWVPVNQAIQAAQKAGSNPKLAVFAQKNVQVAEFWAKSMNPYGTMRESDRDLALSILSTATGPGAYSDVLHSLQQSVGLEKGAVKKYLQDKGFSKELKQNPDALSGGDTGDGQWSAVRITK